MFEDSDRDAVMQITSIVNLVFEYRIRCWTKTASSNYILQTVVLQIETPAKIKTKQVPSLANDGDSLKE